MPTKTTSAPRDPAKPIEHYRVLVEANEQYIRAKLADGNYLVLPRYAVNIARARYSAGDPPASCLETIDRAATYRLEHFRERGYRLDGYGILADDLETFAAAELIGRAAELVDGLRRCEIVAPIVPRVKGLLDQMCAVWKDEPVVQRPKEMADIKKNNAWATIPPMFKAVSDRDKNTFAVALGQFLSATWAKQVKALLRGAEYAGRWSFLAAGLCHRIGGVPELDDTLLQYVPTELITRAKAPTKTP